MDVKEAIERRRSIKKYKDVPISNKIIMEILDAGRLAPSGSNTQPWRFYIIKENKIKDKLKVNKAFHQDFVYSSPVIIVCCGDPDSYIGRAGGEYQLNDGTIPKNEKTRKDWFEFLQGKENIRATRDVTIASSFMILRATELGLGTSFIALIKEEILKTMLNIPKRFVIPFVLTLGYPDETPLKRPRKRLNEIIINPKF